VLVKNIPQRFDWASGEPNSMSADIFYQKLWDSTPKARQEQIEWMLDEAAKRAPPSLFAALPPELRDPAKFKKHGRRALLTAYHHAKDIQIAMAAFGYPQWLVGHDWVELATVKTLRDRAIWESDRSVIEWLDKLPNEGFPNAGMGNPQFVLSYLLWSFGLRDHAAQGSMQIHRTVPHHTGTPDARAEMVERGINGQTHHARMQGPYGVRGETAVPFSQWRRNLNEVYVHESAFRSTVLRALGDDSLIMTTKLMQEGKLTSIYLLRTDPLPWTEIDVPLTKRQEQPWGKAVRDLLLQKGASRSWWDLPKGDRVPLIHLGANDIPLLAKYGPDQRVTQGLTPVDPMGLLREAKAALGRMPELKTVGQALFATLGELALTDAANASTYQAQMSEVAQIMGTAPRELLNTIIERVPSTDVDTRAGLGQLAGLIPR
jgi:hypothetical protein